jgi:hypothetical protein
MLLCRILLQIYLVIFLFPPEIAVLSLAFLVIGDPFAAFIGANYGKNRFLQWQIVGRNSRIYNFRIHIWNSDILGILFGPS